MLNWMSVYDKRARYPDKNFMEVTKLEVNKEQFDMLLLQSGSVDITNLDTKSKPHQHTEYLKQEVIISAKNIFSAAESALDNQPKLKKVIIMNQTPRYDEKAVDPMSLKPVLAQLFNNTLVDSWLDSKYKAKLVIGNHNLDCSGGVKEARFRYLKNRKCDGLHMYGPSGKKAYTISVLDILRNAGIVQMNGQTATNFFRNQLKFEHQKRKTSKQSRASRVQPVSANDRDIRQNNQKKQYRQTETQNYNGQRYSVPTSNRFEHLNY
jgi:hypothetical protein